MIMPLNLIYAPYKRFCQYRKLSHYLNSIPNALESEI